MLQKYGLGWWALQLPAVRVIVGSSLFRQFEQQVNSDKASCVVLMYTKLDMSLVLRQKHS